MKAETQRYHRCTALGKKTCAEDKVGITPSKVPLLMCSGGSAPSEVPGETGQALPQGGMHP